MGPLGGLTLVVVRPALRHSSSPLLLYTHIIICLVCFSLVVSSKTRIGEAFSKLEV